MTETMDEFGRSYWHDIRNKLIEVLSRIQTENLKGRLSNKLTEEMTEKIQYILNDMGKLQTALNEHPEVEIVSNNTLENILRDAPLDGIVLSFSVHFKTDCLIYCNHDFLNQVLKELMRNSKKFGSNRVGIHISEKEKVVLVYIKDDGRGMNHREFEEAGVVESSSGGMGTRIVNNLMEKMRGKARWCPASVGCTVTLTFLKAEKES